MKSGVGTISLKLLNGGPNKVQGLDKNRNSNKQGDVYLAHESSKILN